MASVLNTSLRSLRKAGNIPQHIGLILDGNGRWAAANGLPRSEGHRAGEEALFDTVEGALEIGIPWLTAFVFSTENWKRSVEEVEFLMWFNQDLLLRRRDRLHQDGVRVWFVGEREDPRIPARNRELLLETEQLTTDNQQMNLVFAFNYGGKKEIIEATRRLARQIQLGEIEPEQINEQLFASQLYLPTMPPIDLLIRSSGEHRISNFCLWHVAYAELFFTEVLWPDFDRQHLYQAIAEFQLRHRRYGGTPR